MVSKITLFNPDDTPAVYDAAGHTVGGAERVEVDELDAVGQRAVDSGVLVREEAEKPRSEPKGKAEPKTASADAPPLPEPEEAADKSEKGGGGSGASTRARRG
jgi:hypothetical protein